MTANELADELDNWYPTVNLCRYSAIMLRQQQAEIAELKKIVESTIGQAFYEDDYHKAKAEIEVLKAQLEKERNIYAYALYKKASEK